MGSSRREVRSKAREALPYPLLGAGLNLALSLFGMVLLVRYLPGEEYGALALLVGSPALINVVLALGHDQFLVRFIPSLDDPVQVNRIFWAILLRKALLATAVAVLIAVSFGVYASAFGLEAYGPHVRAYAPAIAAQVCSIYFVRVFNALFWQRQLFFVEAAYQVLRVVIINAGILLGQAFFFFVALFAALHLARFGAQALLFAVHYGPPRLGRGLGLEETEEQRSYRRTMYWHGLGVPFLGTNIDRYIVSVAADNAQVAIYVVATSLLNKLFYVMPTRMLRPVIEPAVFARHDDSGGSASLDRMFRLVFMVGAIITMYALAVLGPLGAGLLDAVFDQEYATLAHIPLIILLMYALVDSAPLGLATKALMRPRVLLFSKFAAAVTNVVAGVYLASHYGAVGMALATTGSLALERAILYVVLNREVTLSIPWRQFTLLGAITLVVMLSLLALDRRFGVPPLAGGLLGTVLFLGLLKRAPVLSEEQRRTILGLLPGRVAVILERVAI